MHSVYLLLGSNIGDRHAQLALARSGIASRIGAQLTASSIYETEPWGETQQASFLNQAVMVRSESSPHEVLEVIRQIEGAAHRQRSVVWGPRTLDIDILFYDDLVLQTESLTIPHPQLPYRRFALVPLCEIAPELLHPVLGLSVAELLKRSPDHSEVAILPA